MKTILTALALVTVVASPVLAKSPHRHALSSYAQAPYQVGPNQESEQGYVRNGYDAWAADAAIRQEERRDAFTHFE